MGAVDALIFKLDIQEIYKGFTGPKLGALVATPKLRRPFKSTTTYRLTSA